MVNNKLYLHSGLCTSNAAFCRDSIAASNSPVWEHIVGNWGADDGIGLMTFNGVNSYSIVLPIETYYSQNISSGSTPMPNGATPYSIGMVYRSLDGLLEGKDEACGDIFIVDIQSAQPLVRSGSGNINVPNITVSKTVVGIEDPATISALVVSPNPSVERVVLDYQLRKPMEHINARIYNGAGQLVADLYNGKQQPGQHRFIWNAEQAASGMYYFILKDGDRTLANEKILVAE